MQHHKPISPHTMRWPCIAPTQAGREATPSSDKEAPSNDVAHHTQDGVRSDNKQRPATMASNDEDRSWEVGSSSMGRISATTRSVEHSARMPIDYFKRLLEEACPSHAYPIRQKHKDCGMM
jgi:hypothetical protein